MTIDPAPTAIRDEALRKIGRNVVLFQKLEGIIKFLAAAQHPSVPLSKAKATRDGRAESIRVKTLGQIAGQVVEDLLVGVYDGKRLLFAAKVRAGFVTHTRRAVARQLQGLVQKECPFANLPDRKSRAGALA